MITSAAARAPFQPRRVRGLAGDDQRPGARAARPRRARADQSRSSDRVTTASGGAPAARPPAGPRPAAAAADQARIVPGAHRFRADQHDVGEGAHQPEQLGVRRGGQRADPAADRRAAVQAADHVRHHPASAVRPGPVHRRVRRQRVAIPGRAPGCASGVTVQLQLAGQVAILGGVVEQRGEVIVVRAGQQVCSFAAGRGGHQPVDLRGHRGRVVPGRGVAESGRGGHVQHDRRRSVPGMAAQALALTRRLPRPRSWPGRAVWPVPSAPFAAAARPAAPQPRCARAGGR